MAQTRKKEFQLSPTQAVIATWLGVILLGTILLLLPIAHVGPLSFIDALFTSASALCVTGLMTLNVAESYTLFGQVVILLLIQCGGIGIMVVGTFIMLVLGRSMKLNDWASLRQGYAITDELDVRRILLSILRMTLVLEAIGATALTALWVEEMGPSKAIWSAVFHAVSAFCNAGISTFPQGLEGMERHIVTELVFTFLIVTGGIGFMTLREVRSQLNQGVGRRKKWSLQTKVILSSTVVLLFLGTASFFFFEYHHALSDRTLGQKLIASFFHSASARTAGFANIDISALNNTTVIACMFLMFIGGAPGSAAGGVKVTTMAVIAALAYSRYKGSHRPRMFKRSIPDNNVDHAITMISLVAAGMALFAFLLLITEGHNSDLPGDDRGLFIRVVFEAVSAFGTVGLSLGLTPELSSMGKLLVTFMMIAGRLGPLTVILAMAPSKKESVYEHAEEQMMLG